MQIQERQSVFRPLISHGSYYMGPDGEIVHRMRVGGPMQEDLLHVALPPSGQCEHVTYRKVAGIGASTAIQVGFATNTHPDEGKTHEIVGQKLRGNYSPRLEIYHIHTLASYFGTHGYTVPLQQGEIIDRKTLMTMCNNRKVPRKTAHAAVGRVVNVNREFHVNPTAANYEDIQSGITYTAAKLVTQLLENNPDLKYLFSFHEDVKRWNVYYMYDTPSNAKEDSDRGLVDRLHRETIRRMRQQGFDSLTGIDDRGDSAFGHKAKQGYINLPVVDLDGKWNIDGTLEMFAPALGVLGIGKCKRSFCFEIPGRLSPSRKEEMITTLMQSFISPFLQAHGIQFMI